MAISLDMPKADMHYIKSGDNVKVDDFEVHLINCDHGTGASYAFGVIVEIGGNRILEVEMIDAWNLLQWYV